MFKARTTTGLSILAAVAASTLLLGCSSSVEVKKSTPPTLSADKLSGTLSEKLAAATGQPKPHVSCPEDLVGKVGTTSRCTLTADDGSTLGVTVKVTSVSGGRIHYDFKADDKASPAPN
ncbi:DUF4333 domain-containing protein [Streptomyces dangxiongensis]|uniref:DUF4333 domain-containing protein n=1 Tax=Streptomyces dangxiongensis TaxID=1442032 RepID=A0A3G2JFW9_9ACTN|nr:DUF4333 domain-containing protein [Streptomyces dangxiongensis]AYN41296.1 DUF4333 domain-containing protein [Streptomyces dangxiongensis]